MPVLFVIKLHYYWKMYSRICKNKKLSFGKTLRLLYQCCSLCLRKEFIRYWPPSICLLHTLGCHYLFTGSWRLLPSSTEKCKKNPQTKKRAKRFIMPPPRKEVIRYWPPSICLLHTLGCHYLFTGTWSLLRSGTEICQKIPNKKDCRKILKLSSVAQFYMVLLRKQTSIV